MIVHWLRLYALGIVVATASIKLRSALSWISTRLEAPAQWGIDRMKRYVEIVRQKAQP